MRLSEYGPRRHNKRRVIV
ncbi:hypothetical protein Goshw_028645 [Gossypium schwendimanii]|uniref:Uncharacterized protein n=1 Tax=Gossypium schwendimanii TaxID=34291 RepID=A0A7J9N1N3_GOSSC|nr:hypothetical protein [Gossypium schwendimanii]